MGSFYGTTFKELKETFKKLIIKKKNGTKISVEAKGTEDSITFNEEDNWIVIDGDNNKQSITFSHGDPNHTNEDYISNVLKPLHEKPNNMAVTSLVPGQYFSITSTYYDKKGHQTANQTTGFQLPQTDAEIELDDVKKRLDNLEDFDKTTASREYVDGLDKTIHDRVTQINEALDGRVDKLEEFANNVPDTYATLETTGLPTDLYEAGSSYDKYKSITEILGNIQALNTQLGFIDETKTLSEALSSYIEGLEVTLSVLQVAVKGLDSGITNLTSRVEDLENK